ncbi:hypothetical protein KEM48_005876 [Puccinia striiformis f. sp. tritici PST-130]|nr:hypothetical protein KEM48_005876 [Puccinia striiformis f. sp. tritici PST-130]
MSTYRQPQSVSTQLSQIVKLDGKSTTFPIWQSCIEDTLSLQGTLDIVKGTLTRPIEAKDKVLASQSDQSRMCNDQVNSLGYTVATIPNGLASRLFTMIVNAYEKNTRARRIKLQEAFWNARHDPNEPIALWIGRLDNSWSSIRDTVVYSSVELSLDNTIAALEAHEVSLNGNEGTSDLISASAASSKQTGCSNCGRFGHHSSDCRKPKGHAKAKAGAATAVKLGGLDSDSL